MSRIATRFSALRSAGRKALIPFVTAGDPNPTITVPLMHAMVAAGADLIELGVPFSDPMADGPVIQRSAERALAQKVGLRQLLAMVAEFRHQDSETPVILMGYLNPIEAMGAATFAKAAAEAGVDGVLTVDLPPEEGGTMAEVCHAADLDQIFLIGPTTMDRRIQSICDHASGFVYYVSFKGVTGASHLDTADVASHVAQIRAHTTLPVGVGFGIKDGATAAAVAQFADAVVVGSAIVARIEALAATPERIPAEIGTFIGELRTAIDS